MAAEIATGERIVPADLRSPYDRLLFMKHVFSYEYASSLLKGKTNALEIGCGEGYGVEILARCVKKLTAVDRDRDAVDHASGTYKLPNVSFVCTAGASLPFPDGHFDAVSCLQVIEHIDDDRAFAVELHRLLSPGGTAVIITPNRDYRLIPGQKPWYRHHVREYSPAQLRDLLAAAGFRVELFSLEESDAVYEIERGVAQLASRLARWDTLDLARFVPYAVRRRIISVFNALRGVRETLGGSNGFTMKDFSVSPNFRNSADIIAVCTKANA